MSEGNQAVVDDTKVAAKPATEVDNAREDVDQLDQLLAEYDQGTRKTDTTITPPEPKVATPQPDEVVQKVRLLEMQASEWAAEKQKKAISETIAAIRGDVSPEIFDDDMVEAWLDAQARKDPRLAQAFIQRDQNPRKWAQVRTELGKSLNKKVKGLPDRQATDDREAVTFAVRGASTKVSADPPPKLGDMSDAELRNYTRKNFGF